MRNTSLALSLLLLAGCAHYNAGYKERVVERYPDAYAQSDFDELLGFGAGMAGMPASSRTETCRSLLKRQKDTPDPGVQLHLMVGRLLSDACGDIPRILDGLSALPPGTFNDDRLQNLVAIHTEALKRMNTVSKKLGSLEHKQKTVQTVLESKESTGSKKDENRLLREKLEAIRSMEKQLDESSDGK